VVNVAALDVVLVVLATYRLTRLVTADKITEPLRVWLEARNPRVGYLATCDWCLSVWVAPWPALAVVVWSGSDVVRIGLLALTASAVTGLLSIVEARLDG
jgi:hypothetical protein